MLTRGTPTADMIITLYTHTPISLESFKASMRTLRVSQAKKMPNYFVFCELFIKKGQKTAKNGFQKGELNQEPTLADQQVVSSTHTYLIDM